MQIVGFTMAIWLVQVHGGALHFDGSSAHKIIGLVVVILGTLQPANAVIRPHPVSGEAKTNARTAWEVIHKGSGWIAVMLGIVNVCLGVALVGQQNYNDAVVGIAAAMAAIGIGGVVIFFIAATVAPQNPWALCCVGGGSQVESPSKSANHELTKIAADVENPGKTTSRS